MTIYRFFYNFMFRLIEKRNPTPEVAAGSFVSAMLFVHLAFILTVIKRVFNLTYPRLHESYFYNKMLLFPFALTWILLITRYYKKRSDTILKENANRKTITLRNALITFSSLLIPLIAMIQMLKK